MRYLHLKFYFMQLTKNWRNHLPSKIAQQSSFNSQITSITPPIPTIPSRFCIRSEDPRVASCRFRCTFIDRGTKMLAVKPCETPRCANFPTQMHRLHRCFSLKPTRTHTPLYTFCRYILSSFTHFRSLRCPVNVEVILTYWHILTSIAGQNQIDLSQFDGCCKLQTSSRWSIQFLWTAALQLASSVWIAVQKGKLLKLSIHQAISAESLWPRWR